jgi:hypothetical protein
MEIRIHGRRGRLPVGQDEALGDMARGSCALYDLGKDRWVNAGRMDFSRANSVPLYPARRNGRGFLEDLDVYITDALENKAGALQ